MIILAVAIVWLASLAVVAGYCYVCGMADGVRHREGELARLKDELDQRPTIAFTDVLMRSHSEMMLELMREQAKVEWLTDRNFFTRSVN